MGINYHKPTVQDKRRRAGFWLSVGHFLTSISAGYILMLICFVLVWIVLIVKIISKY